MRRENKQIVHGTWYCSKASETWESGSLADAAAPAAAPPPREGEDVIPPCPPK
jgi:hypothetical protein